MTLYTLGYGKWPVGTRAASVLRALQAHHVELLVDIRHSPCASDWNPASTGPYRMQPWHLQTADSGIEALLRTVGIRYLWLVELGNPQKNDPQMKILRAHLSSADRRWPLNRGLDLLESFVIHQKQRCCLLCACADVESCHRRIIAETAQSRWRAESRPIELVHL